ncbi:MAG: membrane protein insertion efficiency factor YidD [Synergistaceae bacterium]|nr:membrane protein insertion efficiency factor YidD [Synergistaceae bacterium]MBQ6435328.1 membrane protein insertion efficiency factor YidD [Synergistaceae bacterium]MBQ6736995.1 membrane protein insertion efficiency factor YidD [Synergistaceae bacterium]MBQ7068845.1 membrane protein insertion efficiency factor YidD [Synergistaceae bacterium]MBR0074909.1 membrane protein insertion efficiency factor YidD [Synergistaceae bacterium]
MFSPSKIAVILIRMYQILISPYLGKNCRFYPTCSNYAIECYKEWGFFKGTFLTFRRLLKCGIWNPGGYDPPPKKFNEVKN